MDVGSCGIVLLIIIIALLSGKSKNIVRSDKVTYTKTVESDDNQRFVRNNFIKMFQPRVFNSLQGCSTTQKTPLRQQIISGYQKSFPAITLSQQICT